MFGEELAVLFPEGSKGEEIARKLEERPTLPPLLAEQPFDAELSRLLESTSAVELLGGAALKDQGMAEGVRSGLLLWNDDFEASHTIAQGIDTPTGSYWHGIDHRREGHAGAGLQSNLDNARYWFRRVGSHPVFERLYPEALERLETEPEWRDQLSAKGRWDPFLFIDWCQASEQSQDARSEILELVQAAEMRLLLEYCIREAIGGER